MPRRDGTGPMGMGPFTGRGMGFCRPGRYIGRRAGLGYGLGYGYGRMGGFNRWGGYPADSISPEEERNLLRGEKAALRSRLEEIEKILGDSEEE